LVTTTKQVTLLTLIHHRFSSYRGGIYGHNIHRYLIYLLKASFGILSTFLIEFIYTMSKRKFEALTTPTSIEPPPLPLSTSAAASVIDRVNYHDASPTQTNTAAFVPEHLSKTSTDNPGSKPEPQSTPHLAKIIGRVPYTRIEEKWDAREFQVKLFQDSEASILGFMPVDTFLETFLPWRRGSVHVPGKSPYFPSYTIDLEKDMYKPFVSDDFSTIPEFNSHRRCRSKVYKI
jgi:hypothetical protein